MKIIVLGGAGDMGSRAVADLAMSEGVSLVTIADRDVDRAREISAGLSGASARVEVRGVDAGDHDGLVEAITGHDVCASALGPFHRWEARLVHAAIEAGVNYASICDEWEAAESVIDEFDGEARKKGVTVVTGLGASPGLSNVAVRLLAGRLDSARRVDISVYQPLDAGGGPAVIRHMLHIMSGELAVWRDGGRGMVPALSESRVIEFPRWGRIKTWNMGHSEPATIPRFIPGLEEVNFFMGFGLGAGFFVHPARWGLFAGKRRAERAAAVIERIERLTSRGEPGWGALRIEVWGKKAGQDSRQMICGVGQMREATGISLAIGVMMLLKGELLTEEGGVYAPEACIEPHRFLARLRDKGIEAWEDLAMTTPAQVPGASPAL